MSFHHDSFHQGKIFGDLPQTFSRVSERYKNQIVKHFDKKFSSMFYDKKVTRLYGVTTYTYYDDNEDIKFIIQVEHPKETTYDVSVREKGYR